MAHYQRFALRTGDSPTAGHISIEGTFTNKVNHLVPGTKVGFDVSLWQEEGDGGEVTTDNKDAEGTRSVHPGDITKEEKEKYGVVSVSDGEVQDSDVRTTESLNKQVQKISESVDGEVTKVALNPPTVINVH
ncbi:hypothetical protein [Halorhabdus rudnickae]|uniref:hypothetical protein n=1 Tax=Halorhabdus rudnickae TaxID=1775544 RepID=UPI001083257A|nr:hypothetical protein [Halorhabdus rudnickae]